MKKNKVMAIKMFTAIMLGLSYVFLKLWFWYEEWLSKKARYSFLKKNRYKISWYRKNKIKYHDEYSTY